MSILKYFLLFIILFNTKVLSQLEIASNHNTATLFNMDLEDLLNLNVISTSYTGIDKIKEPASVTIINAMDIKLTPFRTMYDLLEVYVPGAIWMTHYDSPHLGIRGIINQRNDKILLLVNGKNMNFKARNGATSELEHWDLDDIEQIEIIRGPGSVIYGPGAVEAVINITTKKYNPNKNIEIKPSFTNRYDSWGMNLNLNYKINDELKLFSFASVKKTNGYYPENGYYIPGNTYFTEIKNYKDKRPFQDILVDTDYEPQIKAHLQLDIGENSSLWARYTKSGTTLNGLTFKLSPQIGFDSVGFIIQGNPINFNEGKNEQFVIAFENKYNIDETFSLNSFLCFDSENNSRSQDYIQNHPKQWAPPDPIMKMLMDPNSLRNKYFACSESELQLRMLLNKSINSILKLAVGFEYSYNFWGKSWWKEASYFRMGDNWNILTDKNSPAYGYRDYFGTDSNDTYFVGSGWDTNTISVFGEANLSSSDKTTFLLSGRIDKDDYSNLMFSPRLAFIYELNEVNYLKLIAQQSVRMNTSEELLIQHLKNIEPKDEKHSNIELIFTRLENSDFSINASAFISWLQILTWRDPIRSTILSGNLNLYGLELETHYKGLNFEFFFNHSYIKQLSWKLEPGISESGISYSDYYKELVGSRLIGLGNDLNNWSTHTSKLIANIRPFDSEDFIIHFDTRIYWGFDGAKDGLQMLKNGLPGNKDSATTSKIINIIEKYNTYDIDCRFNLSIIFSPIEDLTINLSAINFLNLTDNKRLRYDTGSKEQWLDNNGNLGLNYLMKTSLICEPSAIQIGVTFKI